MAKRTTALKSALHGKRGKEKSLQKDFSSAKRRYRFITTPKSKKKKKEGTNLEKLPKVFTILRIFFDKKGEKREEIFCTEYQKEWENLNISEHPPTPKKFFSYFSSSVLCRKNIIHKIRSL